MLSTEPSGSEKQVMNLGAWKLEKGQRRYTKGCFVRIR